MDGAGACGIKHPTTFYSYFQVNRPHCSCDRESPAEPLDYGKVVLEVESVAVANPELAQAAQELATATEIHPPSNWAEILRDIK